MKLTNLFCTLNKQTNTLEKQSSRGRLFSFSKKKKGTKPYTLQ